MSCWSGFWFFVSCHSVMAFPSFTIRWTGAEMLYFHFPVVSNSRWPGDAFFSVLLHEQFTTWSATCLGCSSCRRCSYSTGLTWAFPHKHIQTHALREGRWGGTLGLLLLYSPGLEGADLYLALELQLDSYFERIYSTLNFSVNEQWICLLCLR